MCPVFTSRKSPEVHSVAVGERKEKQEGKPLKNL
jgi:hypothetical protein